MNKVLYLLLAFAALFSTKANAQDAIINEWSQGRSTTTAEWVEILIVKDNLSLAGWSLRENEPTAQILFQFASNFPALPAGSLVLVYMDTTNCGCKYPDDYSPKMPEKNTVSACELFFNPQDPKYVDITVTRWTRGNNSANTREGDNYLLYNANDELVHDWDDNNDPRMTTTPPRPGSAQAVFFAGGDLDDLHNPDRWVNVRWDSDELTPGQPNGGDNTAFIEQLKMQAASTVRFTSAQFISRPESAGDQVIEIAVCNPKNEDRTLTVNISGGNPSAVYGLDFFTVPDGSSGKILIPVPANQDKAVFTVRPIKDCEPEPTEQIFFQLENANGFNIAEPNTILYNILDDNTGAKPLGFLVFTRRHTTCPNCTDGAIVAQAKGGQAPYTFSANGRAFTANVLTGLAKGIYAVEITDQNGCKHIRDIEVK